MGALRSGSPLYTLSSNRSHPRTGNPWVVSIAKDTIARTRYLPEDPMTDTTDATRIAFVCVQNAGRSQMAYAFAQRELEERDGTENLSLLTGGTQPADHVHSSVVESMSAVGIDISDRTPREATFEEIQASDYVITMGCSAEDVCPAGWGGENRDWDLTDPDGKSPAEVAEIRDEIEQHVADLFDELQSDA